MNHQSPTEEQLNGICDALIAGNKIEAIRQYRSATGLGLKEAKAEIEKLTSSLAKDHPEMLSQKQGGCASVIVAGAIVAYGISKVSSFGLI